jgi:hypothetical protein
VGFSDAGDTDSRSGDNWSPYHDTMIDHYKHVGKLHDLLDEPIQH